MLSATKIVPTPSAHKLLTIVLAQNTSELSVPAQIAARVVERKSSCKVVTVVSAARPSGLSLALRIDAALGPEAFVAQFDGKEAVIVTGGDSMGLVYGTGALLRTARYSSDGLYPPQPPPATPLVPTIIPGYWHEEANQSFVYGQTPNDGTGTALVPLLGKFGGWDACKQACETSRAINCTACGWGDSPSLGIFNRRCYARQDGVWLAGPVPVPGVMWARRYKLPLPPPPPPPAPPLPLLSWEHRDQPATPKSFRGLYFATHFGNFFANAPASAVHEYLQDMALWGANTLVIISEPGKFANYSALEPLLDRNAQIGAYAQSIGFKVGWIFNNEGFQSHPINISYTRPADDRGDFSPLQYLVCPAKGLEYLSAAVWGPIFRRVASKGLALDHLVAWPYDWGGCGCTHDWPWGAVGFPRFSSEILTRAQTEWGHPNAEGTISTWHFQLSHADEYSGLDKWLRANNNHRGGSGSGSGSGTHSATATATATATVTATAAANWTHAMAAVPGGFEWLAQHNNTGVGGLPTLDFPEYSMFGRCPWGGFGANPAPTMIGNDWNKNGHVIEGGMPYSEGLYLDINQVLRQRQYWHGHSSGRGAAGATITGTSSNSKRSRSSSGSGGSSSSTLATLQQYIEYEFGSAPAQVVSPILTAVTILEHSWSSSAGDVVSENALSLLRTASQSMSTAALSAWRWRILYLRALIDATSYNASKSKSKSKSSGSVLNASFAELDRIYFVERNCSYAGDKFDAGKPRLRNCTIWALRPGAQRLQTTGEC